MAANEGATADARGLALACMSKALEHLDSDPAISPIIGSHLQLAIDMLWASMPGGPRPIDLD
ncbi:MAG TPA: hypothetical protein VFR36_06195 [Sphingomicrobium sp.]|nr:hypothetical protein [Sphingomicrobium sp.]